MLNKKQKNQMNIIMNWFEHYEANKQKIMDSNDINKIDSYMRIIKRELEKLNQ